MNETPQLRSSWPATPQTGLTKSIERDASPDPRHVRTSSRAPTVENSPTIPFSLLDAPSQRFYISLIYLASHIWRIYDYSKLQSDGVDSFWLFTKWVGIDTAFLYGLSGLNIPWLQWSSTTFTMLFIGHAAFNWLVMFQISIPIFAWVSTLTKLLYDREYVISERYVKPESVIRNSSVILGKQIIHILPEGSVMLNPDRISHCIGGSRSSTDLRIRLNQTNPIYMEILRIDLDTNEWETIGVSAKELKKMYRAADRDQGAQARRSDRVLRYPVKQTGLYRLQSVIDESKLEVPRRNSDALVVQCPTASIQAVPHNKCRGDLSNFYLLVNATPPIRIKYSKTINRDDHGHAVLSIPSGNSIIPSAGQVSAGAPFAQDSSADFDISWARTQANRIPLNESLGMTGTWQYRIDEIHDGCGNSANYSESRNAGFDRQIAPKAEQLEQHFFVHEKPRVSLEGYDTQNPIKVRKGKSEVLPLQLSAMGGSGSPGYTYTIRYLFTPQDEVLPDQRHPTDATIHQAMIEDHGQAGSGPDVREPGLYSLQSISSPFCEGEIVEPSSCQLMNPLEPDLSITAEQIPDRCAGNSIGLLVDLDLLGTPPFRVYYNAKLSGGPIITKVVEVDRFHTQIELKPFHEGHYIYSFDRISDAVYTEGRSLAHKKIVLEQDVKPPAFARFLDADPARKACIEETLSFIISLSGEPPFSIDYELLHHGRRQKRTIKNVQDSIYELKTERLTEGGDYAMTLTSITDATACKRSLEAETQFSVGLQRPRASFGLIEGKREVLALENKRIGLPLRLQGDAPWTLSFRKLNDPADEIIQRELWKGNDQVEVSEEGVFELVDIQDKFCPGSIDPLAKIFAVQWITRPQIELVHGPLVEIKGGKAVRNPICEGDEDTAEFSLTGTAPFNIEYDQRHKSERGLQSTSTRKFTAGINAASIRMETSESGVYTYRFSRVGDASYNHDSRKFTPLELEQRVHPRPTASFADTSKVYKYCKEEQGTGETVPIKLAGTPPFHLELEVKHYSTIKPQHINVPNIESNRYEMHLPHHVLALGSHTVTIRKVRDARGCQTTMDYNAPHVQVTVAEIPSILPLEEHAEFCVGDRITYALSGTPPFNVFYTFRGLERKARVSGTEFRRLAEQPGAFIITALSDVRSTDACKARMEIVRIVHEMPSVRVSRGRTSTVDIHEGGQAEILFEFGGTPPFHFTYTRSTTATRGKKAKVLETKNGISQNHSVTVTASDEGTYEVISIRDKFCAYPSEQTQGKRADSLRDGR